MAPPSAAATRAPAALLARSSIGRKMVVALTGLGLIGFVIAHLAGNLQIFLGQQAVNAYAAGLRELGPLLWAARGGLVLIAVVHVVLALQLAAENRAARPVRYGVAGRIQSTGAARSMTVTGLMLLAFVLFHLAHLTWGLTHPELHALRDEAGRPDVYAALVASFRQPLLVTLYVVAMSMLGLHISHATGSVLQSLGCTSPRLCWLRRRAGPLLGTAIALAYIAIPAAVLLGLVAAPRLV